MTKTKLAKAIALTITGVALTAGSVSSASASSTTMYNLFHSQGTVPCAPCSAGETDGWVWGGVADSTPSGTDTIDLATGAGWLGTAAQDKTPLGYKGGGVLHWAVQLNGGGTAQISNADSIARYGVSADIDIAKGGWSDNISGNTGVAGGWRHDVDFGLFKSDIAGLVTLSALAVNGTSPTTTPNIGFTIFKGMDISTASYLHHGAWNSTNNASGLTSASLPGGGTNFSGLASGTTAVKNAAAIANIVAYSVGGASTSNLNDISFTAEAGQIYTIALGGYRAGGWVDTLDGYKLNVGQVSAVPVPGAVWLFGSAMAGFLGLRRSKKFAA
ncbi:PEP-CTERM sorting domain-containing protein [Methylobacter psychrophilus]|uniref:PEP-CTERM sorting domain-containing protein n=1 Tax=Methylobacter psychrophilus TaxID=96941 RepID=UPI0021D49249|nr:PEP-CTERM sorting domain-containing protein [Methylobacter psychrophilus]